MKTLCIIGLFLLMLGCKPSTPETTYPVFFEWTAVGEHGNTGTATVYDMRVALDSLTLLKWANAKQLIGLPIPSIAGTLEHYSTKVVPNITYYFALKVVNKDGKWSDISNIKKFNSDLSVSNMIYFNR